MSEKKLNNINVNDIDVEKTITEYDYKKWENVTKVKILSWDYDKDHNSVVAFDSEKARDKYFEEKSGHVIEKDKYGVLRGLEVFSNTFGHSGKINVDIPYHIGYNYNYVVVEMGSLNIPSNTDGNQYSRHKFFYYIKGVRDVSPNTLELQIELDTWTTFQFDVKIGTSWLERGHYAMSKAPTPQEFLNNRINKYELLGYDEPFSVEPKINHIGDVANFYEGNEIYALILTKSDFSRTPIYNEVDGTFTTANLQTKTINMNEISDGELEMINNKDHTIKQLSSNVFTSSSANPMFLFAVELSKYYSIINSMKTNHPYEFNNIIKVYILPGTLINKNDPVYYNGEEIYRHVSPKNNTYKFEIFPIKFGFDDRYSNITKLYTSPYSTISIKDNKGRGSELSIQDIGDNFSVQLFINLLSTDIEMKAVIKGVGAESWQSLPYTWCDITTPNSPTRWKQFDMSEWSKYVYDFEVPTMVAYSDPYRSNTSAINKINKLKAKKELLTSKLELEITKNSTSNFIERYFNNKNTLFSSNQDRVKAQLNARTSKENTYLSSSVSKEISDLNLNQSSIIQKRNLSVSLENNVLNRELAKENLNVSIWRSKLSTQANINTAKSIVELNQAYSESIYENNYSLGSGLISILGGGMPPIALVETSYTPPNPSELKTGYNQQSEKFDFGDSSGDKKADTGSVSMSYNASTSTSSMTYSTSGGNVSATSNSQGMNRPSSGGGGDIFTWALDKVQELGKISLQKEFDKVLLDASILKSSLTQSIGANNDLAQLKISNDASESSTSNSINTGELIDRNNRDNSLKNISDMLELSLSNNIKNYNKSIKIANKNYDTSMSNIDRDYFTKEVLLKNDLSKNILTTSNQNVSLIADLVNSIAEIDIEIHSITADAKNSGVREVSELKNTFMANLGLMNIGYSIKTLDKSKLREVGDYFLRYGYASPIEVMNLSMKDLAVMEGFSYWKFSDITIVGDRINESNKSILRHLFLDGVKVYSDPDKVGKVSIYENGVKK